MRASSESETPAETPNKGRFVAAVMTLTVASRTADKQQKLLSKVNTVSALISGTERLPADQTVSPV